MVPVAGVTSVYVVPGIAALAYIDFSVDVLVRVRVQAVVAIWVVLESVGIVTPVALIDVGSQTMHGPHTAVGTNV